MKSFMEFVQLKNEAEAPTPTASAQAPAQAGAAPAPAPAPAGAAPAPAAQQQNTPTNQLLDYLEKNKSNIKHYRKFAKVKARQSAGGEQVQTKLNDRNESEVRTTQPNDWVVSNIESQGENQIVDDKTFRKRYDVANPKGDIYSPKAAEFFGVVYNGEKISFAPPNWGGDIMHIEKGYMIGGPNPNEFNKDFYGIDPVAFSKTYKTADQVAESTWMLEVFGESPSKKNCDGTNEIFGRTNEGILDSVVGAAKGVSGAVTGAAKGFVKGAGMVGTELVDTLGGSKVASARLWADHKLALAQGKKLVDVTSGSGRGGASSTLTYDDGHTLDIPSYPPDWLRKLLVKGGSVTYNERPITSSLNPTGMQGLMSNNNESWMLGIFGESPNTKNYDGINEIFGLFGKKPAPAAAPAPQRKPPVATCPFCQSETVFSGSDDSYAPTYAPVLQCEKCNKYWAGNKVPPSGLDPKMAKDSDTKMIVGSVSESAWMRSFLTESFKPYKKSTSDW